MYYSGYFKFHSKGNTPKSQNNIIHCQTYGNYHRLFMATAPLVCTEYKSSHIRQYQTFADQQAPASDLLTATTNIHIVYPCMPRSASMLAPHLSSIRMSPIEASVSGLAYGPGAQKAFGFGPGVCLLTHSGAWLLTW